MPGYKDAQQIREQVSIVLTGPDGKVKDERNLNKEEADVTRKDDAVPQPSGN